MNHVERVCTTQPYCWCGGRDSFSCNCVRNGPKKSRGVLRAGDHANDCAGCGVSLVTVPAYEKMMKRAAKKARRTRRR